MLGCATQAHQSPAPSSASRAADTTAAASLGPRHIPGLALVVLQGDSTFLARGYGKTEVGRPAPVTEKTVFQLGSISKQFLAALVVVLAEDGLLSLDEPVSRYLSGFDPLPPTVRVRHLLNHTSGIRELFLLPEAQNGFDDLTRTREELEAAVRRAPVDWPAGTRWSYSNTNYTLLAYLVERVTGKPYEQVLAERFFVPLGLSSLRQCTTLPQADEAHGHEWRVGAIGAAAPENMNWIRGDGGLCGNASDVARWTRLLATGRVVAPRVYEQMIAPTRLADASEAEYGFALSLARPDGATKVAHNGAMRGFSASAAYYPDAELTVVVLVNRGDVRTESIERRIARPLLGLPEPSLQERAPTAEERRRVLGTYDVGVFDVHIVDRDHRLWLEMPAPGPTTPLIYLGDGEFAGEADPDAFRLIFSGGDVEAQRLRLLMAAMYWYGIRAP